MTNKLPELGRIYQRRDDATHKVLVTGISFTATGNRALVSYGHETDYSDYFMKDFEELPEDKVEIKPETQSHISELSHEVKEAMKELDKELDCWIPTEDKEEYRLTSKAERLLNALNKRFKVSETTKETVNLKKDDEMQVSYKVLKSGEFEGRPPLDQLIREGEAIIAVNNDRGIRPICGYCCKPLESGMYCDGCLAKSKGRNSDVERVKEKLRTELGFDPFTTASDMISQSSNFSSDVEKAKEELREALPQEGMPILDITDEAKLLILERRAQALLNALEAEKK